LREGLLHDFADAVNSLGGSYITAEDVGTTSADMAKLAGFSDHVVGRPEASGGSGDPGEFTAAGVEAAMRACAGHVLGERSLAGRSVAIVGVGSVGGALARRLAADGASLILADVDPSRRALADTLGARWAEPHEALRADVDVLAPCALGGVIDTELVDELRCRIICGSANNQLADDALAATLADRGVLYAPDFIVNAGGLINVSLELSGYDPERAHERIAGIEPVMARVLEHAFETRLTPLAAATELARKRLAKPARAKSARRRARRGGHRTLATR
jgi:leucine dehydrogenase